MSMTSSKTVSATFTAAPKVKVGIKEFSALQSAYDDADTVNNAVIKLLEGALAGSFSTGTKGVAVTLDGGYNADYSCNSGRTTIQAPVTLKSGSVRMKGINMK